LNFRPHPLTGDVSIKTDSNAVKQSVINIIKTNYYERGFNTTLGSNIIDSLFDNITELTIVTLKEAIIQTLNNHEPRVEVQDVHVTESGDNGIQVTIIYNELNREDDLSLTIDLKRIN
jgi:phage baseplate assembly protein W